MPFAGVRDAVFSVSIFNCIHILPQLSFERQANCGRIYILVTFTVVRRTPVISGVRRKVWLFIQ